MVGTSGKVGERLAPATASARILPALICGADEVPEKSAATSPDMVAAVAGAPPLYGTWTISKPARSFSISIVSWCWLPLPPEAYASGGLLFRAYSMNSGKVFGGSAGLIDSTNWFDTRLDTGVRSLSVSRGIFE